MVHTYKLTGMTCSNCEASVKSALLTLDNMTDVTISRTTETAAPQTSRRCIFLDQ